VVPYVEIVLPTLPGGFVLAPYGALVIIGILAATATCAWRAPAHDVERSTALRALGWTLIVGFSTAQAGEILLYRPELLERGPGVFFASDAGMSSFAGFAGGSLALLVFARASRTALLPLLDLIVEATAVGWVFGRLGCSLAHDHPGSLSDFPLAVAYPGGARHDLGFYELIFTLAVLLPWLVYLERRGARPGLRTASIACIYGVARFWLDFLRAADLPGSEPRWLGLTPGQYGALLLIGIGSALWYRRVRPASTSRRA
jgi:phosphatidylglycerol:prolipoprotein diacylglycerol transferase